MPLAALIVRETKIKPPRGIDAEPLSYEEWEAVVGSRVAARTRPVRLERGVMSVLAATSTWSQELALLSDPIVEKLRSRGHAVRSLRFRVGDVPPPDRAPIPPELFHASAPVPVGHELEKTLEGVPDEALRLAIEHAAALSLGRRAAEERAARGARGRRGAKGS